MNNFHLRTGVSSSRHRRRRQGGNTFIEIALSFVTLALLALGAGDFSRIFYAAVVLNNAARGGAQYGSQSVATAGDSSGMIAAAQLDTTNLSGVTVTASQCTCGTSSVVTACASSYCTNNPGRNYVKVDASMPFQTAVNYPFLPSSLTLSAKAVMQVGQ